MYNSLQSQWIIIAEKLDSIKEADTVENKLVSLIEQEKDLFIQIINDTKSDTLKKHSFEIRSIDDPNREFQGKLVRLAAAISELPVTPTTNGKLIGELDKSLHSCFAL